LVSTDAVYNPNVLFLVFSDALNAFTESNIPSTCDDPEITPSLPALNILLSEPLTPAIHWSFVPSHNNEPDTFEPPVPSFTKIPPLITAPP
jgi:hypothetical protein